LVEAGEGKEADAEAVISLATQNRNFLLGRDTAKAGSTRPSPSKRIKLE
jgi:hypothetical protein